jgi:hypothetical protein
MTVRPLWLDIVEEAAALGSLALFVAMLAVWGGFLSGVL